MVSTLIEQPLKNSKHSITQVIRYVQWDSRNTETDRILRNCPIRCGLQTHLRKYSLNVNLCRNCLSLILLFPHILHKLLPRLDCVLKEVDMGIR